MRAAISKAEIESEIASRFAAAFKLAEKPPGAVMSTGIPEVDSLSGGIPRGGITEIFGSASSGRTSFILSALAQATKHEEVCALVDTNNVFDPESAAEARIDFDRLLWIRCTNNLEHAFKAADLVLQGGGFGPVILDLGSVPGKDARRIISSWWYRFRRVLENTPTALIVLTQEACVRSCAALTLELQNKEIVWSQPGKWSVVEDNVRQTDSRRVLSPVVKISQRLAVSPSSVTHASILRTKAIYVERHRPVTTAVRMVQFIARAL
ncbi:MAG: hypothetical protein ACREBG_13070 [Pyrinomonadaceae bacterium]